MGGSCGSCALLLMNIQESTEIIQLIKNSQQLFLINPTSPKGLSLNFSNLISPPIVKPLLVLFSLDDAVPATYILAFVPIDSRIGEAGILVALEFEYGIIHQACIEYSKRAQKLKILYIKPRNLLEEPRLKLRDNILERALPAVGEIHKDGYPRGKFDKFLLNLPAH